jgi:hypothetical protein
MQIRRPSRRRLVRGSLAALVLALLAFAGVATATHEASDLGPGTVESPANGSTVVSTQGFYFAGHDVAERPARLISAGPEAETEWVHNGNFETGKFYDVDPLPNGNLHVTTTVPGDTVVYEYDPETRSRVWVERFDAEDTHDTELVGDELIVANMRNYNATAGRNDDRVFAYNLTTDSVTWEWHFRSVYDRGDGGDYTGDWTHVNDVDYVGNGRYLLSPRNMDQVLLLNRSTGEVDLRLGEDGDHSIIHEQHNPDFFYDGDGNPTILVADSDNDRVVEYTYVGGDDLADGEWERTWTVTGFTWPRDADRLPNGNTLVTDTLNHRVVEITPEGEVVWEYYAPWAPYDAERPAHGPGADTTGPAMRDVGAGGTHAVHGGENAGVGSSPLVSDWIVATTADTPLASLGTRAGRVWSHYVPFVRPVWMADWAFAALLGATLVATGWGAGELVLARGRVRAALGRLRQRGRRYVGDEDRAD